MTKAYLVLLGLPALIGMVFALPAHAAVDSVNLQATTNFSLSVGGSALTFTATGVFSELSVDGDSFDVVFATGGTGNITVVSTDKKKMPISPSISGVTFTCGSSSSTLSLNRGSNEAAVTVTVTPSATTCTSDDNVGTGGGGGSTGGGGGGGGGGGSSGGGGGGSSGGTVSPPPAPVTPPVETPAAAVSASPAAVAVSAVFVSNFGKGSVGEQVRRLQVLLNTDSDTRIAATGPGSSGGETTTFGSLTEIAVRKFQVKHGIAKAGDPGYGRVGPKTRARLGELFGGNPAVTPVATPAATPASLQTQIQALLLQVQELQAKLSQQ